MPAEPIVVDATVLRRFALADRIHELPAALGGPAAVCRAVWDPDEEPGICDQGRSELTRSIAVQHHRYQDGRRTAQDRAAARHLCQQLATVRSLHDSGGLLVIDLDDPEAQLCAELVSRHRASAFGLTFPLAPSAAGSVAVAATRSWRLASDDQDAHTALRSLTGPHLVVTSSELLPSGTTPHRTKKRGSLSAEEQPSAWAGQPAPQLAVEATDYRMLRPQSLERATSVALSATFHLTMCPDEPAAMKPWRGHGRLE